MKIKKILPVVALSLALVACGGKKDADNASSTEPASTTTTTTSSSNASNEKSNEKSNEASNASNADDASNK